MVKTEEVFSLKDIKFTIGIMCHGQMPAVTALSFIDSFRTLAHAGVQVNFVSELYNSIVDSARNNVVREFLKFKESNKLVFIDCDMVWTPEDLIRLMCWSSKYPIVAAMYSTKRDDDPKFLATYRTSGITSEVMENEYGLVKLTAVGTGFCIIDRSVFETMMPDTEKFIDKTEETYRFFKTTTEDGRFIGEDIDFFTRWTKKYGGELWVDPDINPGHVGQKIYKGNLRNALVAYNENLNKAA